MKTLKQFILESSDSLSKTVTLNFDKFENAKEKVAELSEKYSNLDNVNFGETTIELTLTPSNINSIDELYNDLIEYCNELKASPKRSENEQYAQNVKEFNTLVKSIDDFKNEVSRKEEE